MAEKSLKDKTVKGTIWSAADAFLGQAVMFLVGIVLARLLTPEEYGLIGIVTIFTTVLLGVVDSGFSNALIRKNDVTNEDYNTLFVCNLVSSVFLYVLLYFLAPWIAGFFERPQLVELVRVTGLLLIFQAVSIVQNTILTKRIDFKTKTRASVYSAIFSGVVGIGMAFYGLGVWSLVGQQLSRQLLYSVLLWIFNKWWPRFVISIDSLRYMWSFGWKLLVSGLLDNTWKELYQVVVGKYYSPDALGQYTRSTQYASIFSSNITSIVQRVSYPVLSQIRDDKERMVNGYRRIIKTTMFTTAIIMVFLGAISEPLIYCLIGPQWHVAATFLPLICLNMTLYPLHAINLNMLQIEGRTDIFLYLEVVKKIIAIAPLCVGIFVDIYWMLVSSIIVGIISFFLNSYYTGTALGYSPWMQIKDVAPSYGIAFTVAIPVFFLKFLPMSNWIILPMQLTIGALFFYIVNERSRLPEYLEIRGILKDYVKKIKNQVRQKI